MSLEWLFVVTKPSFADILSWPDKLLVLVLTALVLPAVIGGLIGLILHAAGYPLLSNRYTSWLYEALCGFVLFILSAFLAMLVILLIDNFTYTLFGYGIRLSEGGERSAYSLLLALLFLASFVVLARRARRWSQSRRLTNASYGLAFAGLAGGVAWLVAVATSEDESDRKAAKNVPNRPNILILSADGVQASRMSVYGAERDTTPYLRENANEWLIFDAAYSNGADSGASIISMLTGKYPTTTRLIYPPDVLRGRHAYEHLPGILRREGYYNADVSVRHYVDPYDLNMRTAFAEANGRKVDDVGQRFALPLSLQKSLSDEAYFVNSVMQRLVERYQHMFDIEDMDDAYAEVLDAAVASVGDNQRRSEVSRLLREMPEPYFLHVHLMAPHGDRFRPAQRHFSKNKVQRTDWDLDFYDDVLLDYDRFVEGTIQTLSEQGRLSRSVIVLSSDHGIRHDTMRPVPLLFRFPQAGPSGRIRARVERLDVAPTLVDYLNIPVPGWMEGRVLTNDIAPANTVFSTLHAPAHKVGDRWFTTIRSDPPFFSLGRLRVLGCGDAYTWGLSGDALDEQPIPNDGCSSSSATDSTSALRLLRGHLRNRGYDF